MKKLYEVGIGSFKPGREPNGKHTRSIDLMGPTSNADSVISQRMQYQFYPEDYEKEEEEEIILECRVYRNGKYCLLETLQILSESNYADRFAAQMNKMSNRSRQSLQNAKELPDAEEYVSQGMKNLSEEDSDSNDESTLDEFSGAAAGGGGPAVPIGYTAKGKPETPAQRRKRQQFNITKSYPYNKLANPPQSKRKKRKTK